MPLERVFDLLQTIHLHLLDKHS